MSSELIWWNFLGGLSDLSHLPRDASPGYPIPFGGCIRQFHINERYISLNTSNVFEARNIADCDGTPCGGDVCLNGGTCWLDGNIQPHCTCPEQYTGPYCNAKVSCLDLHCKNHGRCIQDHDGFECSCPLGWIGDFCDESIKPIQIPQFMGSNSYMIMEPLGLQQAMDLGDKRRYISVRKLDWFDITYIHLNFSTAHMDGMLLWSDKGNEFLGIGIERGLLKIAWAWPHTDTFIVDLPSIGIISDGNWHNLTLIDEPENITLFFDGKEVHSQSSESDISNDPQTIMTNGIFYLGGFPKDRSMLHETNGLFNENFQGCIDDVKFESNQVITDFSSFKGENVGVCNLFKPGN